MLGATTVAAVVVASLVVIAITMAFVLWHVHRTGRVDVIDTAWGASFSAIALAGLAVSWQPDGNALRLLVAAMTVVWGVRLAVHIGVRNRGADEDRRYADLFARHRGGRVRVAALWVCLPQGLGLLVVSLPIQLAYSSDTAGLRWFTVVGLLVWLLGMIFEVGGDAQLARFRSDPRNRGRVLDGGFWRYTRHPNYFGDACVWWGIYLAGCTAPLAAFAIVSPIAMSWLLARGTGKPVMERHLSDRPGYAEYVRRTSGFLPMPRRR
ncbi:MAG: DUF1295 domain-containing protein [Actinomycetia bacterium]|nr:DUF1295 domain-containing protein [Actinomycetes bacterium]